MPSLKGFASARAATAIALSLFLTAPVALPAATTAAAQASHDQIVKKIEQLEIRVVKAHDYKDFVELFDPNVEYWFASYHSSGFQNFLKDASILYPNVANWDVPILDMHIVATDNMAAATSMQVWNSTYADSKKPAIRTFYRQTNIWMKKPDGRWQIVQSHVSIPIDPLTERVLCLDADGYCALPNFPHRSLDANAIRARNDAEVKAYNPPSYKEGQLQPGK